MTGCYMLLVVRQKNNFNDKFKLEPTTNIMNTILDTISVCSVERNISVPANFGIPFQGILG